MDKLVEHVDQLPHYEQDAGPNIEYQFVVKPGAMGLMSAGRVRAKGPTTKALDRHAGWDQLYIILNGSGAIVLEGEEHRVSSGHIVRVPRNTQHGVVLREGEEIEYIYVNAFRSEENLAELLRSRSL